MIFLQTQNKLVSDSESHIFKFVYRGSVHDVEIVFSGRKIFRDFYPGNPIVDDIEFRIFEDEIVAELNRHDLIESVSLDDDESIFIIPDRTRSDIGDIDGGGGMLERESDFRGQNPPVFQSEKYEVLSS